MRKKLLTVLYLICVCLIVYIVIPVGARGPGKAKPFTINFSHTMAPNSLSDLAAKKFKEGLEAKSGGAMQVNVVGNCGLSGGDLVMAILMLGSGDIDMHASAPTNAATLDPRFYIYWMPFLFPDQSSLGKIAANEEVSREVNEWFEPLGIRMLGIHNAGARQISNSVKPIKKPEDLKAMNIRVPGAQLFVDCFRDAFKANPTAMDFSEVYTALQQKTIDGQENPISVFTSSKFEEVQNHLSLWDYVRDSTGWYLSSATFEKMTGEQRAMLLEAATEAIAWADAFVTESEEEQLKRLGEKGVTITVLTDAEKAAFAAVCQPLYRKYEPIIGKDVIALFQRAVADK